MILDFFRTAAHLKKIRRRGWVERLFMPYAESVADHSYSMAVMGMVVSKLEGLDSERVLKMILLHDLAESRIGDITPGSASRDEKSMLENAEFEKIIQDLPDEVGSEYREIWQEYLKNASAESRIVHQIDKLEMALQAMVYRGDGYSERDLEPFFESARSGITNPMLSRLLAGIEESCQKETKMS